MPTRVRKQRGGIPPGVDLGVAEGEARPVTTAPLVRSCSRLMARSNVVLPEPEGPMRAVTLFFGTSKVALLIAVRPLKDTATSLEPHGNRSRAASPDRARRRCHHGAIVHARIHSYRLSCWSQPARRRLPRLMIKTTTTKVNAIPQVSSRRKCRETWPTGRSAGASRPSRVSGPRSSTVRGPDHPKDRCRLAYRPRKASSTAVMRPGSAVGIITFRATTPLRAPEGEAGLRGW